LTSASSATSGSGVVARAKKEILFCWYAYMTTFPSKQILCYIDIAHLLVEAWASSSDVYLLGDPCQVNEWILIFCPLSHALWLKLNSCLCKESSIEAVDENHGPFWNYNVLPKIPL
jgi:hypothetical protein